MSNIIETISAEDLGGVRKEATLSNGSKLIVFERENAPLHLRASFSSGSRYDPVGKEGLAHFLEHILVVGTKGFKTKDILSGYIEEYGGWFGAFTSKEHLWIDTVVADPSDFEISVNLLHEMLINPLFDDSTIEKERSVILKELSGKKANPNSMLWELLGDLFFQGTEVSDSIFGTEETIKAITKQDLLDFYNNSITSEKVTFIASGGVKIDELQKSIEEKLLLQSSTNSIELSELKIVREKNLLIEKSFTGNQVTFFFGFRTPIKSNSEYIALNIIAEVLGGGGSSTLGRKLRFERGLVYGFYAFPIQYSESATWLFKTSTSKDKLQEVLDVVSEEISRVIEEGLTQDELDFAKKKMSKSLRMKLQTSEKWVHMHAEWEIDQEEPYNLEKYTKGLSECTIEQTKQVAQKYFKGDKWYLAICGDVDESEITINLK